MSVHVSRCSHARIGFIIRKMNKFQHQQQTLSQLNQRSLAFWSSRPDDWTKAVTEAEKIVGYPTSFMSLRCLLSDELSNVAMHMRKLVGTNHPLLRTARGLVYDGTHNLQTRGLIVLLMSKTAGVAPHKAQQLVEKDMIDGILPSQRSLAEITEMIHTANLIHKGVVNLSDLQPNDGPVKDMEFGNKMAVLSGDFLLANASTGLAQLNNTKVVEVISSCIGDLISGEFTGLQDRNGNPCLKPDINFSDWTNQTYLTSGSLLAKSCQAALELADHDQNFQKKAFEFGKNMAYAQQLNEDLKPFITPDDNIDQMSISSAPVIKYILSQTPGLPVSTLNNLDNRKILNLVKEGCIIKDCQNLCLEYGQIAIDSLDVFPDSQAKSALINIVQAVTE